MKASARHSLASSVLGSRRMCGCLAGAALVHVGFEMAGLGGWPCPIRSATGLACPGCGLGRACAALLRGEWRDALSLHAFAPLALAAVAVCTLAACISENTRARWTDVIAHIERRLPFTAVILGGVVFYWLLRLGLDAMKTVH